MQLSWINKFSLLDFPWKTSCIVFTPWCNFRCKFCHNPEFVLPEIIAKIKDSFFDENVFFNFLKTRVWLLDWVSICWWEPTIQTDLYEFIKKIKDLGFAVKLDTNGQKPEILQKLLEENLLDYIAMDIKTTFEKYSDLVQVIIDENKYKTSIDLIINSWINHEFRTTMIKWTHNKEDFEKMRGYISWAKAYYLQKFNPWKILDESFVWTSFTSIEMQEFVDIAKKYVAKVEVRE